MHTLIPREVIGVAYCHAPRQTSDPRDITYDELQRAHQSGSLVGLSVLDNHDQSRRAGSVTKSRFDDESGTLTLHMHMFDTDCGRDALVKLQSKQYRGLSLAHHLHSRRIDEVSVCDVGARRGTFVVQASDTGSGVRLVETLGDSCEIKSVSMESTPAPAMVTPPAQAQVQAHGTSGGLVIQTHSGPAMLTQNGELVGFKPQSQQSMQQPMQQQQQHQQYMFSAATLPTMPSQQFQQPQAQPQPQQPQPQQPQMFQQQAYDMQLQIANLRNEMLQQQMALLQQSSRPITPGVPAAESQPSARKRARDTVRDTQPSPSDAMDEDVPARPANPTPTPPPSASQARISRATADLVSEAARRQVHPTAVVGSPFDDAMAGVMAMMDGESPAIPKDVGERLLVVIDRVAAADKVSSSYLKEIADGQLGDISEKFGNNTEVMRSAHKAAGEGPASVNALYRLLMATSSGSSNNGAYSNHTASSSNNSFPGQQQQAGGSSSSSSSSSSLPPHIQEMMDKRRALQGQPTGRGPVVNNGMVLASSSAPVQQQSALSIWTAMAAGANVDDLREAGKPRYTRTDG